MAIVIDSSVVLAVALDEPERGTILAKTAAAELLAPELLPYEIGNALSAMVRRNRLSVNEALTVLHHVNRIPIRLTAVRLESALEIAFEQQLFAYDAYFLQCARSHAAPLITLDRQMQRVAKQLGLKVQEL